eukprot:TRINITY_DN25960_c0_g1_i1.p1 TRINITY_DN25960_c0_g1~~TRINITY_DN25960_c0_g1_i1.p1  ORF type:complete len:140 (+),score=57.14 TRINITY_DN25960_c0_g1_i1:51-470(+)
MAPVARRTAAAAAAQEKKPLTGSLSDSERLREAYKNPGGWMHYKIAFFMTLLLLAAAGCYWKVSILEEDLQKSWDAYDHHCHDHPDPSMDCAHHLIHIRTDETMIDNLTKAVYASLLLAGICAYLLGTQTREELNSKLI